MECDGNGHHKVVNIHQLRTDTDKEVMELGYRWRGTCTVCNRSILAKDVSEYVQFE